jgi:hypothetical protein
MAVARAMRSLSELVDDGCGRPLDRLVAVAVAVEQIPGARSASVSQLRGERFTTVASTAEQATGADGLQYETGSWPCVDAVLEDSV